MNRLLTLACLSLLSACGDSGVDDPAFAFATDVTGDVSPWKHENFDADDDKFTFAIFADLTGGERGRVFDKDRRVSRGPSTQVSPNAAPARSDQSNPPISKRRSRTIRTSTGPSCSCTSRLGRGEGEETFSAIEAALTDRPYTVFTGHVQAFGYEKRNGRDYIRLATTGGEQFPKAGRSADHVTLVTVDDHGVDIAHLLMSGILDKTGRVPLGGDTVCFERAVCEE